MGRSPRTAVTAALSSLHRRQSYSNMVLDDLLRTAGMNQQDTALASRLFYGVIERQLTLDYLLDACCDKSLKKLHPSVLEALRVAVYQMLYMDRIPDSAAVSEAVNTVRELKQGYASGLVNGILRNVLRRKAELFAALAENDEGLSVRYSCPKELIAFWRDAFGADSLNGLLGCLNEEAPQYVRVNTLKVTDEEFSQKLSKTNINYQKVDFLPHCFRLKCTSFINHLESTDKNCYYYQDIASQWACQALSPVAGEAVADVCAAPGGKSFTVAQMMNNTGRLLSCDLYPQKCEEMEKRAAHFGITLLQTAVRDAAQPCPEPLRGAFDRVMCDVPCSGLGVIRRKPEIRYKSLSELRDLPELQYTILERSAELVRPGGVLQYSTCTLNPAENQEVVSRFLHNHSEFSPRMLPIATCFKAAGLPVDSQITLFPHIHGSDGFFIAGFCKKEVS